MIRYLKTFIAAARLDSFSAAGAQLGLTQAAVSMQIQRLEQELNCKLFERIGKTVTISAHGKQLLVTAEQIVALFNSMKGQTDAAQARGRIDIGAISTVQQGLLPKALTAFRRQFPKVEVNIVPGTSVQLMSLIDSNDLSLAVMIRPTLRITKGLKWTPLLSETYVAICSTSVKGPTSIKDLLADHPFLRYSRRSYGGQLVDRYLKRNRLQVDDAMELDEPMVLIEMVREGLGVSIIPYGLVARQLGRNIRVIPLPGQAFHREIGVLQRTASATNIALDGLIECIANASGRLADDSRAPAA